MLPFGGGFSASASSGAYGGTAGGATGWNEGTWNLNLAGSGRAIQSASGGISPWMIAAGVLALYLVLRK